MSQKLDSRKQIRRAKIENRRAGASRSDELLFQPWFLPKRACDVILGFITPAYRLKMRAFFDDYGCMLCGRDFDYMANGMCSRCCVKTRAKLLKSVKRRLRKRDGRFEVALARQARIAKRLLRRFASPSRRRIPEVTPIPPVNPVDEAVGTLQGIHWGDSDKR